MSRRVWALGLAAAAFLGAQAPARADEPAGKPGGPVVVLVGAGTYQDPAIDPRPTADADAKALYDLFTDPKHLGVPADRVKLLLSAVDPKRPSEVATRDNIVKAVEAATAAAGKDDPLVLGFFGRGASAGDKTVFFTPNTVLKDRGKTGLVFGPDLEKAFKDVKGEKVLWMMDVQYKGFKPGEEKIAEPTLTDVDALLFGGEEKEESVRPQDRMLLLSGYISSESVADGDLDLFAKTVADALKGAADATPHHEGYEPDGVVTTDELVRYLEKEMPDRARRLGKTDKEKEAQPLPIGGKTTHFVLTHNPAAYPQAAKRLEAFAEKAGALPEDAAKEGKAFLARMPKLKAGQELRRLYQKVADGTVTPEAAAAERVALKAALKLPPKDAQTYAKRVGDATEIVTRLYVKETNPGDLTAAAVKGMYRRVEEPLPPELEEKLKAAKGLSPDQRAALLADARTRLGRREDLDENKDADLSILMMMAHLNDPYTTYFDKETVRKAASQLRGRFPGVGIQIRRDAVRDALLVVTPIKGSPAYNAGIRAGDLITKIVRSVDNEGKPLPPDAPREISTKGMKQDEAVGVITGKPGSPITLVIDRDGKELTFPLKRNWVSVETVFGVKRSGDSDWEFMLDEKNKIGYIRLGQFTQSTYADLKVAIEALKRQGMTGLVLDLRGNPGGFLTSAVNVSELFVGPQKIVTVKPREGNGFRPTEVHKGRKKGEAGFELAVLVNGGSASASEIVAAAIRDHERGVIVGDRSFGKGSVQDVIPFDETEGEVKLTIARYFPPSDRNIDKLATKGDPKEEWGVKPDAGFEVKLSREEETDLATLLHDLEIIPAEGKDAKVVTEAKDKQLKAAMDYLRGRAEAGGQRKPKNGGSGS
ncbi:MAG: S41 family peptidase [Gemmataceae bacterium]|nr:S41 family peptidase [Gemmataceae bacterium]